MKFSLLPPQNKNLLDHFEWTTKWRYHIALGYITPPVFFAKHSELGLAAERYFWSMFRLLPEKSGKQE